MEETCGPLYLLICTFDTEVGTEKYFSKIQSSKNSAKSLTCGLKWWGNQREERLCRAKVPVGEIRERRDYVELKCPWLVKSVNREENPFMPFSIKIKQTNPQTLFS